MIMIIIFSKIGKFKDNKFNIYNIYLERVSKRQKLK